MTSNRERLQQYKTDPFAFVQDMWGLTQQAGTKRDGFIEGRSLTWQQVKIFESVKNAMLDNAPRRIVIRSGHGIGKSSTMAMLILWFLFSFYDSQVGCTAPTSDQMYDVLWKEISKWLSKMPDPVKGIYEWSTSHIRIRERPETWFARAKTARKENPEALAGLHGEHVLLIVDEASGVPEEIYRTAEGSLTNRNILVIMISNPTRLTGYFYDAFNKDKPNWQCLAFSSMDSPIVDTQYVDRIRDKYGADSDEYRVRVLGEFPKAEMVDDKGYVPLITEADLHYTSNREIVGIPYMGIDPSGEGNDKTVWVVRDMVKAFVAGREDISSPMSIAQKTLTIMREFNIDPSRIYLDNFGAGANVAMHLMEAGVRINPVNVGHEAADKVQYLNKRAECYWRLREWLRTGQELVSNDAWDQLLGIRYRSNLKGQLQIMPKDQMKKDYGLASPDVADALSLTFWEEEKATNETDYRTAAMNYINKDFDRSDHRNFILNQNVKDGL